MVERISGMPEDTFEKPLVKSQAPEGELKIKVLEKNPVSNENPNRIKDPDTAPPLLTLDLAPSASPTTPAPPETLAPNPAQEITPEPNSSFFDRFKTPIRALLAGVTLLGAQTVSSSPAPGGASETNKGKQGNMEVSPQGLPSQTALDQQTRRVESMASEEKRYTEYTPRDFKIVNGKILAIINLPDETKRLHQGKVEPSGRFVLESKANIPFEARSVAKSPNSETYVIVGGKDYPSTKGHIMYSKDGKNWQQKEDNKGPIYLAQLLNESQSLLSSVNLWNDAQVMQYLLDLQTGNKQELVINQSNAGDGLISFTQAKEVNGSLVWKGVINLRPGYFIFTKTGNEITAVQQNADSGYLRGRLVEYIDNNKSFLWSFNNDSHIPENPGGRTGKIIVNIDNIRGKDIWPHIGLYPSFPGSINVFDAVPNKTGRVGYMATSKQDYDNNHHLEIEEFSLDSPDNLSLRRLLPKTGLPAASKAVIQFIEYFEEGQEKYLFLFADSGIYRMRLTNSPTDVWEKVEVIVQGYELFIPLVNKPSTQ